MRIDAHQHFWRYRPEAYAWIGDGMQVLRRDFLPGDLAPLLEAHRLDGCVAVQARQDEEETRWLLDLALEHEWIRGVVGWCDLTSTDAAASIERLNANPALVGLRHIVQDEPDDAFLLRDDFSRGVAQLAARGLAYDLLIVPRQASAAVRFAERHDGLRIVLDHLGKPDLRAGALEAWAPHFRTLARLSHVHVKLSGLVTEADWERWTPEQLAPALDAALEAFGPERVMFGSDWPVCLLAAGYERWLDALDAWAAPLSPSERAALFGGNAVRFYRLETPRP